MRPPQRSDPFDGKTPVAPHQWIRLEGGSSENTVRAVDLLCPIGKGTRGLIVAPPKTGKTTFLKQICQAVMASDPSIIVHTLLIDERPEEVTDFTRTIKAQVHSSSSDRSYDEHIALAEKVARQATSQAAGGADVLVLLDSLTRLSRVHNVNTRGSSRTMSGGLDARAMEVPRRFFGAARKLEEGGSLTILATILVGTGSRMDEVIFQEFKGTGNMELVLSRPAAEARCFPAIDVRASGTRKEELLLPPPMLESVWKLRRSLADRQDLDATKDFVSLLRRHPTNERLLATFR